MARLRVGCVLCLVLAEAFPLPQNGVAARAVRASPAAAVSAKRRQDLTRGLWRGLRRPARGGSSAVRTTSAARVDVETPPEPRTTLEPYSHQPEPLPAGPSAQLVLFVWASNAVLLAPIGILAKLCGLNVGGEYFAVTWSAAAVGCAWSVPWLVLSLLPLDEWFERLRFLRDVTQHTELFTATLLGSERGPPGRFAAVLGFATLLSVSAGVFEELAFRGTAQRLLSWSLAKGLGPLFPGNYAARLVAALEAIAIVVVSGAFGMLHNYCRGYAALAALAGAYFGTIYAVTKNLFVASVCHAVVDVVAFGSCYLSLIKATPAKRADLATREFATTTTLRAWRARFDSNDEEGMNPPTTGSDSNQAMNVRVL